MTTATPMQKIVVPTNSTCEMIEITHRIRDAVTTSGVNDGIVVVYVPHTTAGVTINENADSDVKHDLLKKLSKLIPRDEPYYRHGEGNSDSHLKSVMTGQSVTVLIDNGRLLLGQWQGIFLCEFDGPRERQVLVKAIGE